MRSTCFLLSAVAITIVLCGIARGGDVLTQRNDNLRTGWTQAPGWNPHTTQRLHPMNTLVVDGNVYAQPLYLKSLNQIFIGTAKNFVYAFNATTGSKVWSKQLAPNDASLILSPTEGCNGMWLDDSQSGHTGIGINATPVIDPTGRTLLVSYRTNTSASAANAKQMLVALDLQSGNLKAGPVVVAPPNAAPDWLSWHANRSALLLSGGVVYVGFGSRCEGEGNPKYKRYNGWLLTYDARGLQQVGAFNTTPPTGLGTIDGGGIWQGGTGVAADDAGNLYYSSGNRRMSIDLSAGADAPNLADSVLRLAATKIATPAGVGYRIDLRVADSFSPYRKAWLDRYDFDIGSAGVALIPQTTYLVAGGKQGMIYVLNRKDLGKLDQAKAWTDQRAQTLASRRITECPECQEDFTADRVIQKFQAAENQYVPRDLAHISVAGGGIATIVQDWDQPDVFTVGRDGALWVTFPLYHNPLDASWHQPTRITSPNLISQGARVATARQNDDQLDAFFVDKSGALNVTWESSATKFAWQAPRKISPDALAQAGACVSAAKQNDDQLDVFFVDTDGAVRVTWENSTTKFVWQSPQAITPQHSAVSGSCVAVAKQQADQLDAFYVSEADGSIRVLWENSATHFVWQSPIAIPQDAPAPKGACLSAILQNDDQLDLFFAGSDGGVSVSWENSATKFAWQKPRRITNSNLVPAGTCIGLSKQGPDQLDAFFVERDGAVYVTWENSQTHFQWQSPIPIMPKGIAPAGSIVAALDRTSLGISGQPRREDLGLNAFVVGSDGATYAAWVNKQTNWQWQPALQQVTAFKFSPDLSLDNWQIWPHVHGTPVIGDFGTQKMMYVWPEKDYLKAYRWLGDRFDTVPAATSTALALPGPPEGMPGGMLSGVSDSNMPSSGLILASLPRCAEDGLAQCSNQGRGIVRMFDASNLKEIWSNTGENYLFSKFVPPTIAEDRLFVPTCSNMVLVYGR